MSIFRRRNLSVSVRGQIYQCLREISVSGRGICVGERYLCLREICVSERDIRVFVSLGRLLAGLELLLAAFGCLLALVELVLVPFMYLLASLGSVLAAFERL